MNPTDRNHPNRAPFYPSERKTLTLAIEAIRLSLSDGQPFRVSLARDLIAAAYEIAPGIVDNISLWESSAETALRIYGEIE